MSTSKLDTSQVFQPVTIQSPTTKLLLSWTEVAVRENGIQFISPHPIPAYTEMTVNLRSPVDNRPVRGTGVVVECAGNHRSGYAVSLLLVNLTSKSQERLSQLARAQLA
jgi:hypothetical protein